jgi:hypothetical protein
MRASKPDRKGLLYLKYLLFYRITFRGESVAASFLGIGHIGCFVEPRNKLKLKHFLCALFISFHFISFKAKNFNLFWSWRSFSANTKKLKNVRMELMTNKTNSVSNHHMMLHHNFNVYKTFAIFIIFHVKQDSFSYKKETILQLLLLKYSCSYVIDVCPLRNAGNSNSSLFCFSASDLIESAKRTRAWNSNLPITQS